ncbi:12812_t:CDS:2, partial [Gigaspora margarita]
YGDEDLIAKKQKCKAVLKTVDQEHIARYAYRSLANIKNELPHQDEHSNIDDPEIVCKVVSSIGKGAQRSIKDILKYIVPNLVEKEILNPQQPVINLRISGDGRNVVLYEIEENGFYNDIAREIIIYEMKKINVHFEFWQESQTWNYISLMGEDKLKLKLFLTPSTRTPDNLVQDGGNGVNQKSAIIQILEFENRKLYYNANSSLGNYKVEKLQIKST